MMDTRHSRAQGRVMYSILICVGYIGVHLSHKMTGIIYRIYL